MMKRYILLLLLIPIATIGYSQVSYDNILVEVEKNNTTLQALKQQVEAMKLENRTGIYLDNPEVDFKHMFSGSSTEGSLTEIEIRQSFDFPSAYRYKSNIADGKNQLVEMEYRQLRKDIMLEVATICINLTYQNALREELSKRLSHAISIADATQAKFSIGETDVLERNKAQLNLLSVRKSVEACEVERNALLAELARLNGGNSISFNQQDYAIYLLPPNFESWFEQLRDSNPVLLAAAYNVELSKKQEKLSRAMSLPKLSAGYVNERTGGNTQHGILVGMSVPLWQNKNTVKTAKIQTKAYESTQADVQLQLYNALKMQYDKACSLSRLVDDYRKILNTISSDDLLKKALDKGQLSLLSYLMELSIYYDAVNTLLEAERDYQYAVSELRQWEY